ncbi:FAD:protein FMN transferase [Zavarzinella formosa]|uniref:FAD:protein FMN transferase n=1 Tax=Zavarzinella formosa TaxID=360055 RepID=UPI0002FDF6FE|nr:FAD:protein FMN transferase [Zavarzinella formosa]
MRNTVILLVGLLGFSTVCAEEPGRFEFEEPHMGTKFRIVLYAKDRATADAAAKESFARVAELNRVMSDYLADSELSKLCAKSTKALAGPVKVSDDLFPVLAKANEVSALSDGSFDVTIGPVVKLWRQARKDRRLPDEDVLKEALSRVGYRKMEVDPKAKTVNLTVAGMQLDLGGIAKGHAADECLKIIAKHGITQALVAASGDIAVSDAPPGKPGWKVAIGRLPGSTAETKYVWLKNAAISTSGDEVQFVEIAGVRYSHIADPKTGLGLTGRRSVTVIARRGIEADSLTKMASILPADKVLPVIDKIDGAATLIVVLTEKGEDVRESKGFGKWVVKE